MCLIISFNNQPIVYMETIYNYWKSSKCTKSKKSCKSIKRQYLEEVLSSIASSIENNNLDELKEYLYMVTIAYEKSSNNIIDIILKTLYDIDQSDKLNISNIVEEIPEMTSDIVVGLCLNIIFNYYKITKNTEIKTIMNEKLYNRCINKIKRTIDLY